MNHRPATKSASTLSNTRSYRADRPMVVGDDRSSHAARSSATMVAHSDGGIRMRTGLGVDDVADLLDQPLIAVLATRRADDSIMLSPVWFEWYQGGIDIWVPTVEGGKVGHVQRDPRVTVVVANSEWPYKGFELRGEATGLDRTGRLSMAPSGAPPCATRVPRRRNGWSPSTRRARSSAWSLAPSERGTTRTRPDPIGLAATMRACPNQPMTVSPRSADRPSRSASAATA
jgi:hypothetical protein